MVINIRKATAKDIDALYDLIIGIAKYHNQEQYVQTNKAELLTSGFGDDPKFEVLLAEFDSQIAGYLSYTWNYSIWNGAENMNLDDLFVKSDFRGKKVGQILMEAAKAESLKRSVTYIRWEVETDNTKAIAFYEKLGANMAEKGIFKWKFQSQKNS